MDYFNLCGNDYLLLVDSHSKWMEAEVMSSTTSYSTVKVLRRWIAQFGLPKQLVSDNEPQFTSVEFSNFLKMNGIKHVRCSAYHPSSNGGAERFVQTIKQGLRAIHIETGDTLQKLNNYLFRYRSTPSSTTGKTPAELFLGRGIRTRLNIFKPGASDVKEDALVEKMRRYAKSVEDRTAGRSKVRCFSPHQQVLVANHVGKQKWLSGKIVVKIADRTYMVQMGNKEFKRHVDDIIFHSSGKSDAEDSSWMFLSADGDVAAERHGEVEEQVERTRNSVRPRRTYPRRERRPVDRFGMVSLS